MEKILCINKGMYFQGSLFSKYLSDYFEVDLLNFGSKCSYEYELKESDKYKINIKEASEKMREYDLILALDQRSALDVVLLKNHIKKTCFTGVHILDYPLHVLKNKRDFNFNAMQLWNSLRFHLQKFDFVICNQKIAIPFLKTFAPKSTIKWIRYPVKPIKTEIKKKDFIVFSGRLSPDKGIINIISALSLVNIDIPFITIGTGYDYSNIAKHLKVDYKNIEDCSEIKKWEAYNQCRFLICGADVPYIPSLCILEGISIEKTGIVFDYEENRLHYEDFVFYCEPNNLSELANLITTLWNNPEVADSKAKGGAKWVEENCSYSIWAKEIYEVYKKTRDEN